MDTLKVDLGNDLSYNVHIGELGNIDFSNRKVAIITNPKVCGLHITKLTNKLKASDVFIISIKDGEQYKNIDTVNEILNNLFNHKLDRKSVLISLGGGVVGDICGFVAGIYQRGIDFINIPTTLLSQVDASVGGKTGINNSYGKNLIGLFNQPKAVHIDTIFLSTLASREYNAGMAEIIKMAVAFDLEFFNWLQSNTINNDENLKKAIKKSIELKIKIVQEDEKEMGVRAKLNYGHTFCHIVEMMSNYTTYLHGEAVSIGIIMANTLALDIGLITQNEFNQILSLLKMYDLPTKYYIKDIDSFYDKFFLDKKSMQGKISFILPINIGNSTIKDDITKQQIQKSLLRYNDYANNIN